MKIILAALMLVTPVPLASAMSPEAYYLWATQRNQEALRAAYKKHDAAKARIGDRTVRGSRTEESSSINHRYGGGVGYEGFGGEGGYSGYSNTYVGNPFGFNYGYGFGQPGNATRTGGTDTTTTYEKVWHDEAWYGGAVDVINPFCPPRN